MPCSAQRKTLNIPKIKTNSHDLPSEIGYQSIPKTPWVEIVYYLCDTMRIEDEKHSLKLSNLYSHQT